MFAGRALQAADGKVSLRVEICRQAAALAAAQYGLPLMGTVMDVLPESPPLVSIAVTVTEPETGRLAAGMLMSNLPAGHEEVSVTRSDSIPAARDPCSKLSSAHSAWSWLVSYKTVT